MKTPFGIHAEYVSNRAVDNCINMFKKEGRRVKPGVIGEEKIIPELKDSLDCSLEVNEISRLKIWHGEMHDIIDNYIRKFPILKIFEPWGYIEGLNIQYYKPGGGYRKTHCERMGKYNGHRLMAFMTYLTDTKNGGTKWNYLDWEAPCKKGLTLIWPVDYLYTHTGVISNSDDKMIITGWLGFKDE